jgi:hypothetical protein
MKLSFRVVELARRALEALRAVFEDERDYQRMLEGLEQRVGRSGWDLLSFVLMPNRSLSAGRAESRKS